jgi:aldehyde dehydrogenase
MPPAERISIQDLIRQAVRRNLAHPDPASGKAPGPSPASAPTSAAPIVSGQSGQVAAFPAERPSPHAKEALGVPGYRSVAATGRLRGQHDSVEVAVAAAGEAFQVFRRRPLKEREAYLAQIRRRLLERAEELSRHAVEETGLGRAAHKLRKNRLVIAKTPGPEILTPEAMSGDDGLTLIEYAPFGVIAAITPVTNPSETVINNAISMLAGGNTVVFNPHPSAWRVTAEAIHIINEAGREAGAGMDLLHACAEPSIESAQQLMKHPDVRLLVVTGGPGVVKAAMNSGKKVIAAGAGNPPAVVDATADLTAAAECIIAGASFDNNIICVAEKVVVVEESVHAALVDRMRSQGCRVLQAEELSRVEALLIKELPGANRPAVLDRRWIGKDAVKILRAAGVAATGDPPLALALVPPEHPLNWTEQMLPILPIVSAPSCEEAIAMAQRFERGNRHTAMMHSKNIDMLSRMATVMDCAIFVKNGSCAAGLGAGGEGYTSFTIASPTGEGLTNARTFCRRRRCVLVGSFRIV